jgi:hypothetical protein
VSSLFSHLISKDIFSKVSPTDLLRAIDSPNESGQGGQVLLSMPSSLGEVTLVDVDKDDYRRYVKAGRVAAERVGIAPGASGLIINGRVRFTVLLLFQTVTCHVCRSLAPSHLGNSPQRISRRSRIMSSRSVYNLY